jgi:hypothetical protein
VSDFALRTKHRILGIQMKLLFGIFLFLTGDLIGQTGPAGVGTSTNNALWLKADAGTSSTTNSTAISSWNDQSGNSVNMTQTVSAQQPSFTTNVINGFPAILFDNTNSSNQNDKMVGPDASVLDNTNGYTFFYVTRPMNFGDAHVIVSKRTSVSVDQSFMLFYYSGNNLYCDVQTTNDRFASNTSYTTATNYIGCLMYNGAIATSSLRCTLYNGETFDRNATETSTLVPDNSSPILIGTTDASDSRPFGGYMAEIIIYREALNDARRIIVNNYLSAKYGIALSANDKYAGDNAGNGNYDREVAGVGQESTGSNTSFSASVAGGLAISVNSGLDNGDYILAGHALATNVTSTNDVGGMTGTNNMRWQRSWYVDVTNTLTSLSTNIEFDMSDGGMGTFTLGALSNYVLLYRSGQTGNWTESATASSISGDKILFNSYSMTTDGYYTLGTKNASVSPLPITLISLTAERKQNGVDVTWTTASEINNDYFIVQRSKDGMCFEDAGVQKGAGNSNQKNCYVYCDTNPYKGISYYRLQQNDKDGSSAYSSIVSVDLEEDNLDWQVYPNPTSGQFKIRLNDQEIQSITIEIKDLMGRIYFSKSLTMEEDGAFKMEPEQKLPKTTYLLLISTGNKNYSKKLIIE